MDGNDSLKRILRRMTNLDTGERDGPSCERTDSRTIPGDMYISREEVNKWAKELVEKMKKVATEACMPVIQANQIAHWRLIYCRRTRTTILAQSDGKTCKKTLPTACGASLMKMVSSWPSAVMDLP
jgi:hypothetical protein